MDQRSGDGPLIGGVNNFRGQLLERIFQTLRCLMQELLLP